MPNPFFKQTTRIPGSRARETSGVKAQAVELAAVEQKRVRVARSTRERELPFDVRKAGVRCGVTRSALAEVLMQEVTHD